MASEPTVRFYIEPAIAKYWSGESVSSNTPERCHSINFGYPGVPGFQLRTGADSVVDFDPPMLFKFLPSDHQETGPIVALVTFGLSQNSNLVLADSAGFRGFWLPGSRWLW